MKIEFLPQRHEAPHAQNSKVDQEVLQSQISIARHLLKNRDAFVFVEGNMTNLPQVLSPAYYRACTTRRFDRARCRYPSLWRSIRGARIYFSRFNVREDLMSDGTGPLLKDRGFMTNIVAMGAPVFLYFLGAVRYVIFSDSATHLDGVSKESKILERLFGDVSGCFMAAPKSRLYSIMFPAREQHVLKVIDRSASRFPQQKHILVFGGLHDFTKYNGSKYQFVIPKPFASEAAHGKRVKHELASSCSDLVANAFAQGVMKFIGWFKQVIEGIL